MKHCDVAIVGGGILGVAHALEAIRLGRRVVLFEKEGAAWGASVRNFGMVWPIGQPEAYLSAALLSRERWLSLSEKAGFWAAPAGSLHLAHRPDEQAVLEEFMSMQAGEGYRVRAVTPAEACRLSPAVKQEGLRMAMFSETEVNVDPRQALQQLHRYLQSLEGVEIRYRQAVRSVDFPYLQAGEQQWKAEQIIICSGTDFETLFPAHYQQMDMTKCKLQMMRTRPQPAGFDLGANLAAGLTLQHYGAFAGCPSLPALKSRIAEEQPHYNQYGIHVLLSATAAGELTIGDSHAYGQDLDPFIQAEINDLILKELYRFARFPQGQIAEYWAGYYAKSSRGESILRLSPQPGVWIVNGIGGAGMTLSFGMAQETFAQL